MQAIKQKKVMKMRLLIGNIMTFLLLICSCKNNLKNEFSSNSNNYRFISVSYLKEKKNELGGYNVIEYLKKAKRIKGPVKSIVIKKIRFFDILKKDTILIIVYGDDHKFFKFNNNYYLSEIPILPIGIFSEPKWRKKR
ncbi:hypothetical protein SD960_15100 [Flavobacterium sp. MMLR14_040]|nr:hypothetical protein [Flavobacterium sp. MMLR14_040]